jgi:D-aspartate ligase
LPSSLPPAVVVSGHIMALGVVRSLGAAGIPSIVVGYRDDDLAHASRWVTRAVRAARPDEDPDRFIEALAALGPSVSGSPLIPASDEALVAVAARKTELQQWYRVACPEESIVRQIIHKEHTYALAHRIGVPAPRSVLVRSASDLDRHAEAFGFPCLLKPSQSHLYQDHFGRKMVRVDSMDALRAAYDEADRMGFEMMLQELIPGGDGNGANYNSLRLEGRPPIEFTAAKIRLAPRSFGPPCVVVSQRIPEIVEPGRRILDALGFDGYSCVEFKKDDRDGRYKLMEVNGRFNLSSALMLRCGVNFPLMVYQHLVGQPVPAASPSYRRTYWISGTKDVLFGARDLAGRRISARRFLRPYASRHVFAVLDRQDLRPSAVRYAHLARRAVALLGRRLTGTPRGGA